MIACEDKIKKNGLKKGIWKSPFQNTTNRFWMLNLYYKPINKPKFKNGNKNENRRMQINKWKTNINKVKIIQWMCINLLYF